jgi:hypothetical protein
MENYTPISIRVFKEMLTNFGKHMRESYIEILKDEAEGNSEGVFEHHFSFRLYTNDNSYTIIAIERDPPQKSYLGCVASGRKPRAGATVTGGSDLPDGELSLETWSYILGSIVAYELVEVYKPESN